MDTLNDSSSRSLRIYVSICNVHGTAGQLAEKLGIMTQAKHFFPHPRCFEVFGLDFLPDAAGKVWLLEANACPSLWLSSNVVEDTISLVHHLSSTEMRLVDSSSVGVNYHLVYSNSLNSTARPQI